MNDFLYAIILSLVQGITEFLPISSSAHMIVMDKFLTSQLNNQAFMIVSHTGSLLAVVLFFWRDIYTISKNFMLNAFDIQNQEAKLGWNIIISTIPAIIVGGLFNDEIEKHFYTNFTIGINTIIFGVLLGIALWKAKKFANNGAILEMTWKLAVVIGCMQALSLLPGVSRSGITLTAGLLLGLSMLDAAKYAFLLAIPVIVGAITLTIGQVGENLLSLVNLITLLATFISSYLTLKFFFYLIQKANLWFFVVYRLGLGIFLLFI